MAIPITRWLATIAAVFIHIPVSADILQMPEGMQSLETVEVACPGNSPDDTGIGTVAYPFRMGRLEVTAAQYAEFLNAVASVDDPHELWNNDMEETAGCGIIMTGQKGNYRYTVAKEMANRPVNHVNFWDACRFCNWLHNGQGKGDTDTGAYTLNGYKGTDGRGIARNPDARWFVPNEDRALDSPQGSNSYYDSYLDTKYYILEVGSFARATSGLGTFDQAGNVMEWNESMPQLLQRGLRGGAYGTSDGGRNLRPVNREIGLWAEKRLLLPALQQSYEHPPFAVRHGFMGLTRDFLTDSIPDISTLELEDEQNYYLIASNNGCTFDDVTFAMKLPHMTGATPCKATVLNEDWSRTATYDPETQEWTIPKHPMCFGDIDVWVLPKSPR